MHSALYHGWLDHRRLAPTRHAFRYRLFMVYVDLDEFDAVFGRRWWWSTRRFAPARFDRRDHVGDPAQPLGESIRALVAERTGRRPEGPIRLLTHLRYWGYAFNPVSFYYCFDASGEVLQTVVAEVTNTPWGERHCYVLERHGPVGAPLQARSVKAMHVSPFHPMGLDYAWQLHTPGDALAVHMTLRPGTSAADTEAPPPLFAATLALQRAPITGRTLAATLLRFPWMTAKVILAIHWEALRLWLKRVPVHDHPSRRTAPTATPTEFHR